MFSAAFPDLPRPRRRPRWLRTTAGLAIGTALIGAVAYFGYTRIRSDAAVTTLAVGDCLDEPEVDRLQETERIDCALPHQLEVFAVLEHPASANGPFPGNEELLRWAAEECQDRFAGYVGTSYEDSELFLTHFTPVAAGWEDGDRGVTCLVYAVDDNLLTATAVGTVRDSGR